MIVPSIAPLLMSTAPTGETVKKPFPAVTTPPAVNAPEPEIATELSATVVASEPEPL